ncbi:helix-turn-helix transcriptional regulator [filamentous cyanobacterium LEGE 11480]|uniref:Helix-turn-helix transcriptional regulator n=1 Tax=Romeriopsis navalis LEGE 11480 TaxID=2777977 RepID=A0A928VS91_9CYAN|nr:helix-turn-helix transcriptional regulator [Romeriopsis navalis]MBE9031615.1 helix-turn-helix transcriptional regulator [Romeriopsis navalis LEGE 11480]
MELRKRAGFTQQQLASELGKSVSTIAKWEAGRVPSWTPQEFSLIRTVLQCTYEELVEAFSPSKTESV